MFQAVVHSDIIASAVADCRAEEAKFYRKEAEEAELKLTDAQNRLR